MAVDVKAVVKQVSGSTSEGSVRRHTVRCDRPEAKGGSDGGAMGGELFLIGLGGCFMSNLLAAIHDFGGVLTTIQVSTLLWPPDVGRRLAGWGTSGEQIAEFDLLALGAVAAVFDTGIGQHVLHQMCKPPRLAAQRIEVFLRRPVCRICCRPFREVHLRIAAGIGLDQAGIN